jgi:(2S)-methylsuccinyl-CoA dehydrogenase
MTTPPTLNDARILLSGADDLIARAMARTSEITDGGKRIDDHQVLSERVAYAATEGRAARALIEFTAAAISDGRGNDMLELTCVAGVADLVESLKNRLAHAIDDLGLDESVIDGAFPAETRALLRRAGSEQVLRTIGAHVCATRGANATPLDELSEQVRDAVREFADNEVAPQAEHIHRSDALIPESFIGEMSELGYFGLAVPEEYGGSEMGNLAMILTTEELSRASLAGAGSLITRPEILTKALLGGGTEEQKQHWLPKIAAGEIMVGIAVTEPDIGSDVASLRCRAERKTVDGEDCWVIDGPKSWCTFAGRADVLALLARTDPDLSKGA